MQLGARLPFLQISEERGREQATAAEDITKNTKTTGQETWYFNLNMTKAKQPWEEEMERLNSQYNLDCYSDSELDSESDEGEQYCYEHGYETLIWEVQEWICQNKKFVKTSFSKTDLSIKF